MVPTSRFGLVRMVITSQVVVYAKITKQYSIKFSFGAHVLCVEHEVIIYTWKREYLAYENHIMVFLRFVSLGMDI